MPTAIDKYQKQYDDAKKAETKMSKKLENIKKALDTGHNPYYYTENELTYVKNDLEHVKNRVARAYEKLLVEIEMSKSRNNPVIIEFLTAWKNKTKDFFVTKMKKYYKENEYVKDLYKKVQHTLPYKKQLETEEYKIYKEAADKFNEKQKHIRNSIPGEYYCIIRYTLDNNFNGAVKKLNLELDNEADRKYDLIIRKINEKAGTILDASDIHLGYNGEINGNIHGSKGDVKIETISAGGYNIQQFHFRMLVKQINARKDVNDGQY